MWDWYAVMLYAISALMFLFVDDSGVRSIGRVVQEKSNPITESRP